MQRFSLGLGLTLLALGGAAARVDGAPSGGKPANNTPSATTAGPTPPKLRLPDGARPRRYAVELTVVPTEDHFHGNIEIALDVRSETAVVWLNAAGLDAKQASFTVGDQRTPARVVPGGRDFIGFVPQRPLAVGAATLTIDYDGEISPKSSNGLFRQKEGDNWYVFTHFEPTDARRVFPCFDEPTYKVPWRLKLKVRKDDVALTNTPEAATKDLGDGFKEVTFGETRPLPSYLIAVGVGPFDFATARRAGKNGAPVRIVVPKGRAVEARWAQQSTPKIIEILEDYFGRAFPYDKDDHISVPQIGGAMENPGLITFNQQLILTPPAEESVQFRRGYGSVAMHELAHQWFGDLVTTAWWDDIWLNEAFATWTTNRLLGVWQPTWRVAEGAAGSQQLAMRNDSLVSARRIRQPIAAKDDIANAFDAITYQKGAAVIAMFEHWIGGDKFRAGIQSYLNQYANSVATADQFLAAIAAKADPSADVVSSFSTFLNQSGVPLVTAELSCSGAPTLKLKQERYLPLGAVGGEARSWKLPVCASFGRGSERGHACTLLTAPEGELALSAKAGCPDWVNANADQVGYYRVLYQGDLLNKLLKDVDKGGRAARLGGPEKIGVLGDIDALVRAGRMPYADALALLPRFARDPSRNVTQAGIALVSGLRDNGILADADRPAYAAFIRKTYGARARAIGMVARPKDDEDTRLLRPSLISLVADQGEDPGLRAEATKRARAALKDPKAVDPDMLAPVFTIAARGGDRALYEEIYAAAKKASDDRKTRVRLLRALADFRDPELVKRSLAMVLGDDFDPRESQVVIQGALGSIATRQIAYDWVKANFDTLVARMPRDYGAGLGRSVGNFCDEEHRADGERFFTGRSTKYNGGPRILTQALEGVQLCTALRKEQAPSVASFFQKQK